jgi:hypothetical protein
MLAATVRPSEAGFRESCPMPTKRSRATPSPVRVRHEPPTVAEAVAAAQALIPTPLKCDSWAGVVLGAWV